MLCRLRNPLRFKHKKHYFFIRKALVEVQSRLASSRNDLLFAHLHLLLWQSLACICRLQPANSFPETQLVLGDCWFHFDNSPFMSDCPPQMCDSLLVLSACFGKSEQGRQGCVRWSQWVWMRVWAVSTAKMPFYIAAEEHTRSPELQTLYPGCLSGRVGVVPSRRKTVFTLHKLFNIREKFQSLLIYLLCVYLFYLIYL